MKRGVIAIVKKNGKILLLSKKEGFQTIWQFPTCEVGENEEPESSGLRNMKEKFDLDVELKDFLDLLILPKSTIYFYEFYPTTEELYLPKEFNNFSWVESSKLEDFLLKQTIDILPKEVIKTLKY